MEIDAKSNVLCKAIRQEDWKQVDKLLQTHPVRCTREVDESGATPLHWAACKGNVQVVKKLIQIYPAAARVQDKFNKRLPLHYATYHFSTNSAKQSLRSSRCAAIETLVQSYSEGSIFPDVHGNLALKYALEKQAPPESLQMLERATYPDKVPILNTYYTWHQLKQVFSFSQIILFVSQLIPRNSLLVP